MRRAGLIKARRDGKFIHYRLPDNAVLDLVSALAHIGEHHLVEVDKIVRTYFESRDTMEPVSRSELLSRMKKGDVQVLDVRPEDEFALARLPGAINIPLGQLKRKLDCHPNSLTRRAVGGAAPDLYDLSPAQVGDLPRAHAEQIAVDLVGVRAEGRPQ